MFIGLFIAYEPLCLVFGCTLGNYLKGIRVRKASDTTKRINIFQAIIRYPIKLGLGWILFLTINSNPKRRAIHDLTSGSVMIKNNNISTEALQFIGAKMNIALKKRVIS